MGKMVDLKNLNDSQRKAVEYVGSPQMIIAGAGSGKTRVLIFKIAYLIQKEKYKPESILALTFTNKAANEMKERIKELIKKKADNMWMGTFHSIFAKILRMEAKHTAYQRNFSIYDTEDSLSLVNNIINNFDIDIEGITPNSIRHRISFMKNHMVMPKAYRKSHVHSFVDEKIADIYDEYQKRLVANNAMDFDDLLLKPIELFNSKPNILQKYKKKFSYILVDEFQDTNKAQYELLKLFVSRSCKITVVGDDAQSIYSWRGANLDNSPTESLSFNPIYFSNSRRKPFTFFCILSFISITSKTLAIVWKSEILCFLAKAIIRVTVVLPIPLCGKFIILSKLSSSFWLTITRRYAIISFTSFLL